MRKLNDSQQANTIPATPKPKLVTSWMPRELDTAVLDPRRWSQRAKQRRQWQLIATRRRSMH